MKTATQWFDQYAQSHQNKTNKLIHWVCIPVIVTSTLGLLQAIPHPFGDDTGLHWGVVVAALALTFYFRLSWTIGLGMGLVSVTALALNAAIAQTGASIAVVSAAAFFVAWVFQFVGHKIEGEKPSFFEDLQFLLIGPAWLLQFIYRRIGVPVETRAAATRA